MSWNNWSDFIAMGGYGLYVWGAYGMVLIGMLAESLMARRRHQAALQAIPAQAHEKAQG